MENQFLSRNKICRICKSQNLTKFLTLGPQPLANRFLKKTQLIESEPFYPLDIYFCHKCNLVQLVDIVGKEKLFRDYIYFSSSMPILSEHFRLYAEDVMKKFLNSSDQFVVEIGSNDGILLKFFKDSGFKVLGIEPAENIVPISRSLGVETLNDFFNEKLAEEISRKHGQAKVIMANNVVAHINNHHDLVRGVYKLLDDKGVFIFEVPYLIDMFENLAYDTIYHEHLSYLAITPLKYLFKQFGMEIFDVKLFPVQGQSIRVFVGKKGKYPVKPSVNKFIHKEKNLALDKLESYFDLAKRIEKSKEDLSNLLISLKQQGKRIAAYGAPAKGNTLLNHCKIGTDILDYALDDLPSKQGLYTPGMHIPVVDNSFSKRNLPDYYLLLAWNYVDAILEKEKDYRNKGGKFIFPISEIKIL